MSRELDNPNSVHMAILRQVRPGSESDFEAAIGEFFDDAAHFPGILGAYLIRPMKGGDSQEYGILRSFHDSAARERFYRSDLYRRWRERVAPLVEGPERRQELHGMEAFFPAKQGPPAWKMAILTWVAVNPAVYVGARLVPEVFGELSPWAELLTVNGVVVASLTWLLMPALTRIATPWLQVSRGGAGT